MKKVLSFAMIFSVVALLAQTSHASGAPCFNQTQVQSPWDREPEATKGKASFRPSGSTPSTSSDPQPGQTRR